MSFVIKCFPGNKTNETCSLCHLNWCQGLECAVSVACFVGRPVGLTYTPLSCLERLVKYTGNNAISTVGFW